jgi:signal transduction histidine kinase
MNTGERISGTLETGRLAELLLRHRAELLQRWEQRVLDDPAVADARDLPRPVLYDHVPALLAKLVSILRQHPSSAWGERAGRELGSVGLGRAHARQRLMLHYTVEEAMRELSHFRAALLELCEEHAVTLNREESILVHTTVDELMAASAAELEHAAVRAREQLLAIVAHDLRTPLSTVLLQARRLKSTDGARPAAEAIERSVMRMSRLADDLVMLSKADAGRLSIDPHPDDARAIARDAIDELRSLAERKRIVILIDLPAEETGLVCDHERLVQALGNVIGNAVKFTPESGEVRVALSATEDECVFAISDSGPGILAEHLEDIFRPFWQAPGVPKSGVGLGLAIVRGIVEAHGGCVVVRAAKRAERAEEIPTHGVEFRIHLPRGGVMRTSVTLDAPEHGGRDV